MTNDNRHTILSPAARKDIDKWLKKFPEDQKRACVIHALMYVQIENDGYLTEELMSAVADYLELPKIAVYEVATFYSMYELEKVGKHKISLCTNVSCMLCGSDDIRKYLKKKLGVGFGETSKDGSFTLKEVECLGACGGAPAMQINDQYYENLSPEKIDVILASLESK